MTSRTVVISPVTRIEGHAKVTIVVSEDGEILDALLHVVEFRGFERFIIGRPYWEVPVIVERLCGICPVSHHLAAAKAMDIIAAVPEIPPSAQKLRRLMHYAQILQSHASHLFYFACPDWIPTGGLASNLRNIAGLAQWNRELTLKGIMLRRFGQEIIKATAGKRIHGTGAIPGGTNKSLSHEEQDALCRQADEAVAAAREALSFCIELLTPQSAELREYGSFSSNFLALTAADGSLEFYDGVLRCLLPNGEKLFDQIDPACFHEHFSEEVRPFSYMKFPFLKQLGPELGWYRVGPLARINCCDHISTPLADKARNEYFRALGEKPCQLSMAYHWARMIEALHAAEMLRLLLPDKALSGPDIVARADRPAAGLRQAASVIEAPRGTLMHRYTVDENDLVASADLIVATTHNNEAMNRSIREVASNNVKNRQIDTALLNKIEMSLRAYDPCLSCATHAAGKMDLLVELISEKGDIIGRSAR